VDNQTINTWEKPVAEQARANPYPQKRQTERSMRFNAKYEHYVFPEQIIKLEREEAARERAAQRKAEREFVKEWNARATVVFIGHAPTKAKTKAEVRAEKKAQKDELREMERAEAIARLGIPNARPFRSEKNRIGRAR
jgi:hypothetical protein